MSMRIKKGDKVRVIQGKEKGKEAIVLHSIPNEGRVILDGLNIKTYHVKPRVRGEKGEIKKKEAPIDVSNVQLIDPKTKKTTRVGYKMEGGKKVRISKRSGEIIK